MITTTDATGPAGDVHDRTPLILPRDPVDPWLDPSRTDPEQIYDVLDGIVQEPCAVRERVWLFFIHLWLESWDAVR